MFQKEQEKERIMEFGGFYHTRSHLERLTHKGITNALPTASTTLTRTPSISY